VFKRENIPLWVMVFSFLLLGILSRVAQMPEPPIPFLTRLMISEFGFFVALAGIYFAVKGYQQGVSPIKSALFGAGCLVAAILLSLDGLALWQQLDTAMLHQS